MYQGMLNPGRGLMLSVDMMQYLPEEFKLVFVGDGPLKVATMAYVKKNMLNERVKFFGSVPNHELAEYTKAADIGLMPLNTDKRSMGKSGFKLLQYMGLGIVSIGQNITINNEIIEHNVNSYLVSNISDWERILIKVLEKDTDFQKLGNNARQRIISRYTFIANYLNLINFIRKND